MFCSSAPVALWRVHDEPRLALIGKRKLRVLAQQPPACVEVVGASFLRPLLTATAPLPCLQLWLCAEGAPVPMFEQVNSTRADQDRCGV